jgi:hypothetical protein
MYILLVATVFETNFKAYIGFLKRMMILILTKIIRR